MKRFHGRTPPMKVLLIQPRFCREVESRIPYLSKRSIEPAALSCWRLHSKRTAPIFPRERCSRAANCSNSSRRFGRIRRVKHAFHSPIPESLNYLVQPTQCVSTIHMMGALKPRDSKRGHDSFVTLPTGRERELVQLGSLVCFSRAIRQVQNRNSSARSRATIASAKSAFTPARISSSRIAYAFSSRCERMECGSKRCRTRIKRSMFRFQR